MLQYLRYNCDKSIIMRQLQFWHFFPSITWWKFLLSDAFSQLKIYHKVFAAGALAQTPLGEVPQVPSQLGKETSPPLDIFGVSTLRVFGASTLGTLADDMVPRYLL